MNKERNFTVLFASLFLIWVLMNGSISTDVLIVGLAASLFIALVFPNSLAVFSEIRATPQALIATPLYLLHFIKELFKANIRLARIVLSPALPVKPGIVKVRTKLKSRMGRLLLANSITLTPGTLTVEMTGEWIYVHWVTVEATDIDGATASIVAGFEQYLEKMYG
ncbi:MAG: Na+/H+ antiporter subunit E [Candidatus Sedimenticola sp. 6PFRAG1]